MRGEMARGEISTAPFASLLAHPGKPILAGGRGLTRFAPIRALFACSRPKHAPIAIEHGAEELLQCKRVKFATAACRRVLAKRRPPAALGHSLSAQFITYQTQNSVQSNGASSMGTGGADPDAGPDHCHAKRGNCQGFEINSDTGRAACPRGRADWHDTTGVRIVHVGADGKIA